MGYTLLGTLSELLFTQFFHFCFAVHLPACEQCVFFCFSTASVLQKKQSGFPFGFSAFVGKKQGFCFGIFILFFSCAMSTSGCVP